MDKYAPPEVLAIGEINFTGNVTPHSWYEHLRYDSGKPHLNAITILAEIVYWYRPVEVRDETTGELLGYKKKFKGDKLQRSYASFANQFGLTKKQARDAISFLVSKDLVDKELRLIQTEGVTLSNVLFIGINPQRVKEINTPYDTQVTPMTSKSHPIDIEVTPSIPVSQTYTEITTETTTEKEKAKKTAPPPPPVKLIKKKAAPKKKAAKKPIPPAVEIYREEFKRFPSKSVWEDIEKEIGAEEDKLIKWRQVLTAWRLSGNKNPTNFVGLFDWFKNGVPGYAQPKNGGGQNGRKANYSGSNSTNKRTKKHGGSQLWPMPTERVVPSQLIKSIPVAEEAESGRD